MADRRAVLFDLDDTLYPRRRFVLSGFRAVAARVARDHGLSRAGVLDALVDALDHGDAGRELQHLCDRFDLPASLAPVLVNLVRGHKPSIQLPRSTARVLQELRPSWRLAVVTNGVPAVQKRKVEALGLGALVDVVVFASECGSGRGKPEAAGFLAALIRLGVGPKAAVFVGDDLIADIAGAAKLGMKTIHVAPSTPALHDALAPDARVSRLGQVPALLERLVPRKETTRVA